MKKKSDLPTLCFKTMLPETNLLLFLASCNHWGLLFQINHMDLFFTDLSLIKSNKYKLKCGRVYITVWYTDLRLLEALKYYVQPMLALLQISNVRMGSFCTLWIRMSTCVCLIVNLHNDPPYLLKVKERHNARTCSTHCSCFL